MSTQTELPAGLLEDARNRLDITWEDTEGDQKLSGILRRGMCYLDDLAGEALDYTEEGLQRELLFTYAVYVRSEALDEFQVHYLPELLKLQTRREVARYAAKNTADLQ